MVAGYAAFRSSLGFDRVTVCQVGNEMRVLRDEHVSKDGGGAEHEEKEPRGGRRRLILGVSGQQAHGSKTVVLKE